MQIWTGSSIKLQTNFIKITFRCGCSPVSLLHIFRTPLYKNTYGGLLLPLNNYTHVTSIVVSSRHLPLTTQWPRSGIFTVNFKHFTPCSNVSIVNFEHVIAGWVSLILTKNTDSHKGPMTEKKTETDKRNHTISFSGKLHSNHRLGECLWECLWCSVKKMFLKISQNLQKTPGPESLI